jgi:hypothetical protein
VPQNCSCSTWNEPGSRCARMGLLWIAAGWSARPLLLLLADLDAEGEASLPAGWLRDMT